MAVENMGRSRLFLCGVRALPCLNGNHEYVYR